MKVLDIDFGNERITRHLPETWEEMTARQFVASVAFAKDMIEPLVFFKRFLDLTDKQLANLGTYELYTIGTLLGLLKNIPPMKSFIIDSLTIDGRRFIAPGKALAGMTFMQFMTVDTYYNWYAANNDKDMLDMLCASLYLEQGIAFADTDMNQVLNVWHECDADTKEAIAVEWLFIKKWLSNRFKFVFPEPTDKQAKQSHDKVALGNMWLDVYDSLVDDDLTRLESYKVLPAVDVLRIVNRRIKDSKKNK